MNVAFNNVLPGTTQPRLPRHQNRRNIMGFWLLIGSMAFLAGDVNHVSAQPVAPEVNVDRIGVIIRFESEIHALSEQYLYRKLEQARALDARVVVVEIESPGGDVEATMAIADSLRDTEWAQTVAYVPNQALSGAALFSLGCDEIVIGPQAVFGDAGPVFLDEDFLFKHASEKVRSHLARQVRDLAEAGGRPPALAEAMVDMNLVVFEVTDVETGELTYMSQAEIDSSDQPDRWKKGPPVLESREEHFLEVNGARAVELGLADALVDDRAALMQRFQRVDQWEVLEWSNLDATVMVLNHPVATTLLLLVGLAALYFELAAPGLGVGGIISLLCFGVFFWSRFLGGTAEVLDVLLFVCGGLLLIVEFFVIPGFGIWGVSGFGLILASLLLANQTFVMPETQGELNQLTRSFATVMAALVGFVFVAGWMTRRLGRIPILNQLLLKPATEDDTGHAYDATASQSRTTFDGQPIEVGDQGVAESPLRPAGRIELHKDFVDVVSDGSFIEAGDRVEVIQVQGNRVVVRKLD